MSTYLTWFALLVTDSAMVAGRSMSPVGAIKYSAPLALAVITKRTIAITNMSALVEHSAGNLRLLILLWNTRSCVSYHQNDIFFLIHSVFFCPLYTTATLARHIRNAAATQTAHPQHIRNSFAFRVLCVCLLAEQPPARTITTHYQRHN